MTTTTQQWAQHFVSANRQMHADETEVEWLSAVLADVMEQVDSECHELFGGAADTIDVTIRVTRNNGTRAQFTAHAQIETTKLQAAAMEEL